MKDFEAKTAVITGAASGIGKAFAREAARRGMKLVLADINEAALSEVAEALRVTGSSVLALPTDVSSYAAMEKLAKETEESFGKTHLLFNNAGVSSSPKALWESSLNDWKWVLGVNLESVIYGIKAFVPAMLEHAEEAHIINTASIAGLIATSRMNTYGVSKHAVVALSETLLLDLQEAKANIAVSVLCPAWVKTRIHFSERNRPEHLRNTSDNVDAGAAKAIMQAVEQGMELDELMALVFAAIEAKHFYILSHKPFKKLIRQRMEAILTESLPSSSW